MGLSPDALQRRIARRDGMHETAGRLRDALQRNVMRGALGRVTPKYTWARAGSTHKWHRVSRAMATWEDDSIRVGVLAACCTVILSVKFSAEPPEPLDGRLCGECLDQTERFAVYRAYDEVGALLYLGYSSDLPERIRHHSRTSHWFQDVAQWAHELFPTAEEALAAELAAIESEDPIYNRWRPSAA